jgi:hypothetical protein
VRDRIHLVMTGGGRLDQRFETVAAAGLVRDRCQRLHQPVTARLPGYRV